jgi:hypothetical protein
MEPVGRTTWYLAWAIQPSADGPAHARTLVIRSPPGVSPRTADFAMLFSGFGAQYHPSVLMTDTFTAGWLDAHVQIVPIRLDQLPCQDRRVLSVVRPAGH